MIILSFIMGILWYWWEPPYLSNRYTLCWHKPSYLYNVNSYTGKKTRKTSVYSQISNIRRTKSQNLKVSRLILQLSLPSQRSHVLSREWKNVDHSDAVGASPVGAAPTTSEWSTILLPTKVRLILEVWRYIEMTRLLKHPWRAWDVRMRNAESKWSCCWSFVSVRL